MAVQSRNPRKTPSASANLSIGNLDFGKYAERAPLYPALPDGSPGLDRPMKIVSLKVQPDSDEGELVTVMTGEHTVAVD